MDGQHSRRDYEDRIGRVVSYVFDHLDDELDLNVLAEVACLSPYHWHRIYQAMRGETITATVRRLRLSRAAALLAQTPLPVAEIARRSGYANLQSFSRIFRSAYGMPPATYRRRGSHTVFAVPPTEENATMYDVSIRTFPPRRAVTLEHVGPYMEISRAFDRLSGWLGTRGLFPKVSGMIALYHDDPSVTPADKLHSRAGFVLKEDIAAEAPVEVIDVPGGDYAVLRHKGPYADMKPAYDWLYGQWLPKSGREPADAPAIEEYLNTPMNAGPTELLTDICIPLK